MAYVYTLRKAVEDSRSQPCYVNVQLPSLTDSGYHIQFSLSDINGCRGFTFIILMIRGKQERIKRSMFDH